MASILRKAERRLNGTRAGGIQYTKSKVERQRERHEARVLGRPQPHGYLHQLAAAMLGIFRPGRRGI